MALEGRQSLQRVVSRTCAHLRRRAFVRTPRRAPWPSARLPTIRSHLPAPSSCRKHISRSRMARPSRWTGAGTGLSIAYLVPQADRSCSDARLYSHLAFEPCRIGRESLSPPTHRSRARQIHTVRDVPQLAPPTPARGELCSQRFALVEISLDPDPLQCPATRRKRVLRRGGTSRISSPPHTRHRRQHRTLQ